MDQVTVNGKEFKLFIERADIWSYVVKIGKQIEADYIDKNPLFIAVLNGSFIFAADLFHVINIPAEISFVKLSSYKGTASTGKVLNVIGLNESIKDRHVIIVEDIVDTGQTLSKFLPELTQQEPASVKVATFLSKPAARTYDVPIDYQCLDISNKFVVGYGLDYDGQGRNLTHLYEAID